MSLETWCKKAVEEHTPLVCEGGILRVHVISSRPRPVRSLYPLAHIHPTDANVSPERDGVPTWQEHLLVTAGYDSGDGMRLIYAIELYVYTLARERAGLVYVSKLDSTGFAPRTPPSHIRKHLSKSAPSIASILTSAVLKFFVKKDHWTAGVDHIALHICARAQNAYLFPSSDKHPCKHILSDAALIRWWQACLSDVVVFARSIENTHVDSFYVIPGYSHLDSHAIVPIHLREGSIQAKAQWHYGHPYSTQGAGMANNESPPPLPLHPSPWEKRSALNRSSAISARVIPTLIPIFPDDPKGRFVNEQGATAHEPGASFLKLTSDTKPSTAHREAMAERQALERLTVDGFWQRMGFRQECSSGNVVGMFVVGVTDKHQQSSDEREYGQPQARLCALPHPLSEELVLKHIVQDACNWCDANEAVKCTQRFYEAVDRAVQRKAGGPAALYADITLNPISEDELARAKSASESFTHLQDEVPSVRVLNVRKKARRS